MACKCYHAERNFVGKIGVCWGTKEREACSCGGDESKCDFYEDKRKKATPKTTNYDRIISKTPEELADFFGTLPCCPPGSADELCYPENTCGADTKMMVKCWARWLKAPVEEVNT